MGLGEERLKTRHLVQRGIDPPDQSLIRFTPSARKDQTCSPLAFRTVNHAIRRKSMGPDPSH